DRQGHRLGELRPQPAALRLDTRCAGCGNPCRQGARGPDQHAHRRDPRDPRLRNGTSGMVAIKAGDVDAAIARPSPQTAIFLVYGPDSGLVGERVRRLVAGAVDNPDDPFQLVRLDGDEIASDPLRLADEAHTVPLFGGRRAIWLRAGSRNLAPALTPLLQAPPQDTVVIVEAGDLARTAPLRQLCEKSPAAAALPCYADSVRDIGALIDEGSRKAGVRIEPDARELLVASLGADRAASRSELDKLFTYAHGQSVVTVDDVAAVVGDVSAVDRKSTRLN